MKSIKELTGYTRLFNKGASEDSHPPLGKTVKWKQHRCPECNALLFEIDEHEYKENTVRVKCRLCKKIDVH